eukprot:s6660_g3.t1
MQFEQTQMENGRYFTEDQCRFCESAYYVYRASYDRLASMALAQGIPRWKVRPKQHMLEHEVIDFIAEYRLNPRYSANYMGEDAVRRVKQLAVAQHMLEHEVIDFIAEYRLNPRYSANYMGEDAVRRVKQLAVASHPNHVSRHVLLKWGPSEPWIPMNKSQVLLMMSNVQSQVLVGTAPGIPWPSISPSAWTRIGGGLELGRLRSEPLATALHASLRGPHDSEERQGFLDFWGGSGGACRACQISIMAGIDHLCLEDSENDSAAAVIQEPADADETPPPLLAPPASTASTAAALAAVGKSLAIVPAASDSDRPARQAQRARSRERPLPLHVAEPEEAPVEEPEPQPESPIEELLSKLLREGFSQEERLVTAVATEPCESRGVRKAHFQRRLSQPEESQQDPESCEVVERWLEMLRRPLPMVQKLEASLAEDTARSPERRRSSLSLPSSRSLTLPVRKTNTELVDDDDLNKEELQQHWLRLVSPSNLSPSPVEKSEREQDDASGVTGLSPTRWLTPSLPSRPSTARPGSRPASARPGSAGPRRLYGAFGAHGHRAPGRQSSGTPPRRSKGQETSKSLRVAEARPASAPIVSEVQSIPRAPALMPRSRLRRFGRPSTPVQRGLKQEGCLHMAYVLHRPLSAAAKVSF